MALIRTKLDTTTKKLGESIKIQEDMTLIRAIVKTHQISYWYAYMSPDTVNNLPEKTNF